MQRDTAQRRAIRNVFGALNRSPQEILEAAQEHVPNMGLATVYSEVTDREQDDCGGGRARGAAAL